MKQTLKHENSFPFSVDYGSGQEFPHQRPEAGE